MLGKRRGAAVLATIAAAAALLFVFTLLDLSWAGSTHLSLTEVWDSLWGNGTWANDIIVNGQNMPRIATGICVGSGLAVTGGVMQAVFRNPLATPYILGLSSGASLGAAVAILLSAAVLQPLLAFAFCFGTMLLVYAISRSGGSNVRTETLVLAGVAVSSLISAVVSFLTYIAPSEKMGSIVFWSLGSLSGTDWGEIAVIAPITAAGILMMAARPRSLNAMMLGDAHAMDLGVDVKRTRLFLLAVSSLTVAACVCFVGTIGFVGLVIPHLARALVGPNYRVLLPASLGIGAVFLLVIDDICRVCFMPEMPIAATRVKGWPYLAITSCRRSA